MQEIIHDDDLVVVNEAEQPAPFDSKEKISTPRIVLQIPLPDLQAPANAEDPTADMGDRMNEWTRSFKQVAERFLKTQGYSGARVVDFESLQYTDGFDKDDYVLKIALGASGDGMVGDEGITTVPIIVRRAPKEAL